MYSKEKMSGVQTKKNEIESVENHQLRILTDKPTNVACTHQQKQGKEKPKAVYALNKLKQRGLSGLRQSKNKFNKFISRNLRYRGNLIFWEVYKMKYLELS